jgi:indole-3-glycerol phosphate synthase
MSSVLDEIIVGVREDLALRQEKTSIDQLKAQAEKAAKANQPRGLPNKRNNSKRVINQVLRQNFEAENAVTDITTILTTMGLLRIANAAPNNKPIKSIRYN